VFATVVVTLVIFFVAQKG